MIRRTTNQESQPWRSEAWAGLARDWRRVRKIFNRPKPDPRAHLIPDYLAGHSIRKLQLGAGPTRLEGWLSTDLEPHSFDVARLDATEPFPFDDNTFDYVFSEHMIEHISWDDGQHMLRECRRVLKPGGKLRLATPDLAVLLQLYKGGRSEIAQRYMRWVTERFLPEMPEVRSSFVINNAFRNWGHQFIYDAADLRIALELAGFTTIQQVVYGESDDVHLRGIERHGANIDDEAMARFESMIFEAAKPRH